MTNTHPPMVAQISTLSIDPATFFAPAARLFSQFVSAFARPSRLFSLHNSENPDSPKRNALGHMAAHSHKKQSTKKERSMIKAPSVFPLQTYPHDLSHKSEKPKPSLGHHFVICARMQSRSQKRDSSAFYAWLLCDVLSPMLGFIVSGGRFLRLVLVDKNLH